MRAHLPVVERRDGSLEEGGKGSRRTLEEPWAYPRPGDETFAAPEPAFHVSQMRSKG